MRKQLVIGVSPQDIQWKGWTQTLDLLIASPSALLTVPLTLMNFLLLITEVFWIILIPSSTWVLPDCLASEQWTALTSRWLHMAWFLCACLDSDLRLLSPQLSWQQFQAWLIPSHWYHDVADCSFPTMFYPPLHPWKHRFCWTHGLSTTFIS